MRIIHTSDWHLGQNFYGKSRAAEHRAFFTWLIEQVKAYDVDAVIIAGDVFDTGAPPSYARELYNDVLLSLRDAGCQTVVLAGNHDSVAVLNESRDLLKRLDTQVITTASEQAEHQVLTVKNGAGEPALVICGIPFIRPRDVLQSEAGQSGDDKQQALQQAIAGHYQSVFALAKADAERHQRPLPILATGHLTTVGASTSDSVRDIYIGTLEAFPAQAFPNADYIALGHIHRAQKVGGDEHIRYSGSPIHLSFDELPQQKSINLVSFTDGKLDKVEPLNVPAFQPMQILKGDFEAIEQQLKNLDTKTEDESIWLDIEVTSDEHVTDLQTRIRELAESLPVEILLLRKRKEISSQGLENHHGESLSELSPLDVFQRRLELEAENEKISESRHQRLSDNYRTILDELRLQQSEPADEKLTPQQGSLL